MTAAEAAGKVSKRKIGTSPDKPKPDGSGDVGKPLFAFHDVYAQVSAQGNGVAKLEAEMAQVRAHGADRASVEQLRSEFEEVKAELAQIKVLVSPFDPSALKADVVRCFQEVEKNDAKLKEHLRANHEELKVQMKIADNVFKANTARLEKVILEMDLLKNVPPQAAKSPEPLDYDKFLAQLNLVRLETKEALKELADKDESLDQDVMRLMGVQTDFTEQLSAPARALAEHVASTNTHLERAEEQLSQSTCTTAALSGDTFS